MQDISKLRLQPLEKTQVTWAYRWCPALDMEKVSVQVEDTPEYGGWIGVNPFNTNDRWYISKQWYDDNYRVSMSKANVYPVEFLR